MEELYEMGEVPPLGEAAPLRYAPVLGYMLAAGLNEFAPAPGLVPMLSSHLDP